MTRPVSSAASGCCPGAPTPQPLRLDLMPASRRAWSERARCWRRRVSCAIRSRWRPSRTGRRGIGRRCAICCSVRAMTAWRRCPGKGARRGLQEAREEGRQGRHGRCRTGLITGPGRASGRDARNPRTRLPRTGNPAPLAPAGGPGRAGRAVIRRAVTLAAAEPCRGENRRVPSGSSWPMSASRQEGGTRRGGVWCRRAGVRRAPPRSAGPARWSFPGWRCAPRSAAGRCAGRRSPASRCPAPGRPNSRRADSALR